MAFNLNCDVLHQSVFVYIYTPKIHLQLLFENIIIIIYLQIINNIIIILQIENLMVN